MNKNYKHIEDFYRMDSDFKGHFKSTPFDFYLDFIGYTTNRNLKEQEKWEKEKIGGAKNYNDRYKIRHSISENINEIFLKLKIFLVSLLIIVALISIPIISVPGNKYLKHALEWDYFVGVISFYLLTFFMWKKN